MARDLPVFFGFVSLVFVNLLAAATVLGNSDGIVISHPVLPGVELVVSRHISSQHCTPVKLRHGIRNKMVHGASDVVLEVQKDAGSAQGPTGPSELLKIYAQGEERAWAVAEESCSEGLMELSLRTATPNLVSAQQPLAHSQYDDLDVRALLQSGSSENRVDFIFFADGYTQNDKDKFFADAQQLVDSIAVNKEEAFGSVKGLVNWWACFLPSTESGIGTGGKPKDTAFGLYRPGTELRGVYYSKPKKARELCQQLGNKCDYPIILGNSPFYGGIGGEFTTITASFLNGPLVLRHELGHSVLGVGEEYDGGGYFGVNAAPSLAELTWPHWLTNPSNVRAERSAMPLLEYAWTLLNSSAPWRVTFETSGTYPRNILRFSLSGIPRVADLIIRLDGQSLRWLPKAEIGFDRWFYDITNLGGSEGLGEGEHILEFELTRTGNEGIAQLCNIEIFEYGSEDEFNAAHGFIGAFPTYSDEAEFSTPPGRWNTTSYRPTNEDCLMRQVTTPHFCPVCKEELWIRLLSRVDLVEDIAVSCQGSLRTFKLDLVRLLDLSIEWKKDGTVIEELTGLTEVSLWEWDSVGTWDVTVTVKTEEIRFDAHDVGKGHRRIEVFGSCDT